MRQLSLTVLLMAVTAAASSSQELTVGSAAPELDVTRWVRGEPVSITGDTDTRVFIVEFWATWCAPCIASIPHLNAMQQRLEGSGVRLIGVAWNDDLEKVESFVASRGDEMDYTVAFDGEGKTGEAYLDAAGIRGIPCSFVIDNQGESPRIAWIGHPAAGLDELVEDVLSGSHDVERQHALRDYMARVSVPWNDDDWAGVLAESDAFLADHPTSARAWSHRLRSRMNLQGDLSVVLPTVEEALKALAADPRELASFASDSLLWAGYGPECMEMALAALEPAAASAQDDSHVRLAHVRVLDACGRTDRAATAARAFVKDFASDIRAITEAALALADTAHPDAVADAALEAVDLALAQQRSMPLLLAKFTVLTAGKADVDAAGETGREIVDRMGADTDSLNDYCWELLTADATAGRFRDLALVTAEHMLEADPDLPGYMLDTVAFAKFENGLLDEAIELQKRAVEQEGESAPGYQERLERYEAAKQGQQPRG